MPAGFALCLLVWAALLQPSNAIAAGFFRMNISKVSVWPQPVTMTTAGASSDTVVQLSPPASLQGLALVTLPNCAAATADLTAAFARFTAAAFPHATPPGNVPPTAIAAITVCMATAANIPLQLGINESYQLTIHPDRGILINCTQVYGCYHALETLSQLVLYDFIAEGYFVYQPPIVVADAPRFPHRGLMLDTSRHFIPVPVLNQAIDSMRYAKLNTLHWHLVDSQAFPFVSAVYPQIAEKGSYSLLEQYSVEDVKGVVEYARQRGIRVMIELDTPGHTGAMCAGMPEICPAPFCRSTEINSWALDITKNATFAVVEGLLQELASLFPEQLLHIGGDELNTECWQQHPYILEWFAAHNMTLADGYLYYGRRVHPFVTQTLNRTLVGWQEMYDAFYTALDPATTIIQQWIPHGGWGTFVPNVAFTKNVTSHGYRLIWSDAAKWYLDFTQVTWQEMYDAEPCQGLVDQECSLVLGGEGCMWGEAVDTSDLMATVWPRAAAIAERLWSPRTAKEGAANATDRLVAFRCLLNRRGIAAAPPENPLARSAPYDASSCYYEFSAASMSAGGDSPPPVGAAGPAAVGAGYVAGASAAGFVVGGVVVYFLATIKRRRTAIESAALV